MTFQIATAEVQVPLLPVLEELCGKLFINSQAAEDSTFAYPLLAKRCGKSRRTHILVVMNVRFDSARNLLRPARGPNDKNRSNIAAEGRDREQP